jgi:diguanylate cyclase (GGDEF)-like protein/PAS domain S-box-containing protein
MADLLQLDNALLRALLDNVHDGVYFVDSERRIQFWNKSAERITGYSAEEVVGKSCADNILMHVDEEGNQLCLGKCPLAATISDGERRTARVYLHHKEGHRLPVQVGISPIHDDEGRILGGLETFFDASEVLAALQEAERLREEALICPLTGIGNRRYAEQMLARKLDEMARGGMRMAVLFIDIDHFKKVNDTYGHDIGDVVIKMVARTMSSAMRSYDFLARWGGEEFIALLPAANATSAARIAERLRTLVSHSSRDMSQGKIRTTVSIGVYFCRRDDTPESVVKQADRLLYESKRNGRNRITVAR